MKKILITGVAGFIGFHAVSRFLEADWQVVGIDHVNDYYDINLKWARLDYHGIAKKQVKLNKVILSTKHADYSFCQLHLHDKQAVESFFKKNSFPYVLHLAAQAGVRYSLIDPHSYLSHNVDGFLNILEACRQQKQKVSHLVYASTSSVYGLNETKPAVITDNADHPVSLYAATKKANEAMAHTYSHLFDLPTTGLRFFTVYGPWGRPDMALFKFTENILKNKPIEVFNRGRMKRDFTYVADIVENLFILMTKPPKRNKNWNANKPDPSLSSAPYRLFNIGCNKMTNLMDFIGLIEKKLDKKAKKKLLPMQPGDVAESWANIDSLIDITKWTPKVDVKEGVDKFIDWYLEYYQV